MTHTADRSRSLLETTGSSPRARIFAQEAENSLQNPDPSPGGAANISRAVLLASIPALVFLAARSLFAAEPKKKARPKTVSKTGAKAKTKTGSKTGPKSRTTSKTSAKAKPRAGSTARAKAGAKPKPKAKPKAGTKSGNSPEEELGDTPVAPWQMPTPEEKAQAKPIRRALKEAVKKVDSQEKADQVIEDLEAATAGKTAEEVKKAQPPPPTVSEAAAEVQQAAQTATGPQKTEQVLETTARALTTTDKREREAVAEAAQEALNPEQQGAPPEVKNVRERELLRKAVLKRLKLLDALDAQGFLLVNHLPHTRLLNRMFYGLTMIYSGGGAWYAAMGAAALQTPKLFWPLVHKAALPLAISGLLVELPIKWYFRRRRPFITIIQAIVIGKKPGTWSFPSGHSAGAFGGAWLLNRFFPRWSPVTYTLASLVAFSRIYLGDHYPGDVLSGSLFGLWFARIFRRMVTLWKRR